MESSHGRPALLQYLHFKDCSVGHLKMDAVERSMQGWLVIKCGTPMADSCMARR